MVTAGNSLFLPSIQDYSATATSHSLSRVPEQCSCKTSGKLSQDTFHRALRCILDSGVWPFRPDKTQSQPLHTVAQQKALKVPWQSRRWKVKHYKRHQCIRTSSDCDSLYLLMLCMKYNWDLKKIRAALLSLLFRQTHANKRKRKHKISCGFFLQL